jgi:hypothetical protein
MKEKLNDYERGVLIFLIEEYFKTTHNFRGVNEVNVLSGRNIYINPYSFVDFANSFDPVNLLSDKTIVCKTPKIGKLSEVGHSGIHGENNITKYASGETTFSKIPIQGFPEIEDNFFICVPLKKYLSSEDLHDLRKISDNGKEIPITIKGIKQLLEKFKDVFETIQDTPCTSTWNGKNPNAWFWVNIFPTVNYTNRLYQRGNKFGKPSSPTMYLVLKHEPFVRIFSNSKEGCKINEIAKNNKFKIATYNINKKTVYDSRNSFGENIVTNAQRIKLYNTIAQMILKKEKLNLEKLEKLGLTADQIYGEINMLKKYLG